MCDEQVLGGGGTHVGKVVRIGDTVHRPRTEGADVVEAFLLHLEQVGFNAAPRFLGVDHVGRQVLTFIDGDVTVDPAWLLDDAANRTHLAAVATMLRRLHDAGRSYAPPAGALPRRPCPAPGTTWVHGDVHYGNLVFDGDEPIGLLDWDFAMPGDPLYDVVALLYSARCPRLDRPDEFKSRTASARETLDAVLDGYGADVAQRRRATAVAATFSDGAADYLVEIGVEAAGAATADELDDEVARRRFLAQWWRDQPAT